jgi:hypothetical protein
MREPRRPKPKSPGFFALDYNQFERIQNEGLGIEEAAAYLSLMVNTDRSNVTSTGGIKSVTSYSGLTATEAKKAIARLAKLQLVNPLDVANNRTQTKPRYNLPIHDKRDQLVGKEQQIVAAIAAGRQPTGTKELSAAQRVQAKGHIEKRSTGWHILEQPNEVAFIPNSFVRDPEGESPLHRLVRHGELVPIMLAVQLYYLQNLREERGVPISALRAHYSPRLGVPATRVGLQRLHYLWSGRSHRDPETGEEEHIPRSWEPTCFRNHDGDRFWQDLKALDAEHVVEWSFYAANGKPAADMFAFNRPQPLRPLGVLRNGRQVLNTPESIPAFATYVLFLYATDHKPWAVERDLSQLINRWQETSSRDSALMALENQSVAHVEGVGILRMTHRAATENSSAWYEQTVEECRKSLFFIEQAAREESPQAFDIIEKLRDVEKVSDLISINLQ